MRSPFAALASASCSLRYVVCEDCTGWWLLAAVLLLAYAWQHRDD